MVTRRTDARRRRVLSEEFVPTEQLGGDCDAARPMDPYSYGANRRNQPKTTDLIPKRVRAVGAFLFAVLTCVGIINVLAIYAEPIGKVIGAEGAKALALSGSGTIANWFCCGCLFLASAICLQLFKLRQHKRDDYGGMYRVWILMSFLFLLASLDCAVDLRTMAARTFEHFTHRSLLGTPWLWMTIEMIVLGLVVLRMLFEMRISRVALASVTLVWLALVTQIVLENVGLPKRLEFVDTNLAYGNAILVGCGGILVSLTLYARFVYLHAHGFIAVKTAAAAISEEAAADSDSRSTVAESGLLKPKKSAKKTKSKKKTREVASQQATAEVPQPAATTTASSKKSAPKKTTGASSTSSKSSSSAASATTQTSAKKKTDSKKTAPAPANATSESSSRSVESAEPIATTESVDDSGAILKMSKSERRRQRKLAKRAARKAA